MILGLVFVGTLYPLVAEALTGEKLSVGPPYFNTAAGPIALALVAIMAAGPLLRWRRDRLRELPAGSPLPILLSAARPAALVVCSRPASGILPLLGLVLALGVGAASVAPLWGRNLRRTPLFTWGMVIAHLGIAVSLAGMASESAFTQETLVAARPGADGARSGPASVRFDGVEPVAGPNWTAIEARLTARRGDGDAVRAAAAGADVQLAADRDQRGGDRDPARTASSTSCSARPTSRAAGSCGCGGSRSSP